MRRMFANNDDPDAVANLVKLLERCDKADPLEAVTGTIGGKPRTNAADELIAQLERPVISFNHPGPLIPPPTGTELIDQMRKLMDQMNRHTPPMDPADKVVMGPVALAELRRTCRQSTCPECGMLSVMGGQPHLIGCHRPAPMPDLSGIQIVESDVLEPDQWIAYDRKGKIVAMGRASSVGIFAMREPSA
jgi:hypothetical protein